MGRRTGFTLIELLVVIAIIALLLSILMPALRAVREQGRRAVCAQNEKNTGLGLFLYANDYDGKLPLNVVDRWLFDVSYWTTDIILESGGFDRHIFYCPSWRKRDNIIFWRYGENFPAGTSESHRGRSRRPNRLAETTIASWGTSGLSIRRAADRIRP
ncbi:MAG: type II secretion system protein [Phycisphaerales bacterium]|nr:MAG: type II secretion system protein [Phycisphaerales bacterium]